MNSRSQDETQMNVATENSRVMPAHACDCHAHVFGPYDRFPLAEERPYTPPETLSQDYLAMLDSAGFERGVLVHGGASGWNHGAMLEALKAAPARLRGVAVPPLSISDRELSAMHAAGVRGVRFNQIAGPQAARSFDGRLDLKALHAFAPRLRELGWHAQIWANCEALVENENWLRTLRIPLVIDHLGFFDVSRGITDNAFQTLARLLADGHVWVKLTAFRNSKLLAPYSDVQTFHETLVAANPDQVIWGSDWPFLGMQGEKRPTVEGLLQVLHEWIPDAATRERVLCRNPARLYGFR